MLTCPNCGEENPARFRLCGFCGSPLQPDAPEHEVRKTVTIVFCDLKGSTTLGESLDSESLREVMGVYFAAMQAAIELHGGTIEKFIGDAVMAVFGLPRLHEDDALRAVRAAAAMQTALPGVNEELERRWGVTVMNRIGVNTGEVVAASGSGRDRLVTGDAVNVAARLEQSAPAGDVLLGDLTYRLVRDAVDVEQVEPLELKGKAERVPAYRLVAVRDGDPFVRRRDLPLVGRDEELDRLRAAYEQAVATESCSLVTVFGEAGVGKTRLMDEFTRTLDDDALVLEGRCLPYGRGITFWPLVEIVREAAGIGERDTSDEALAKLAALVGDDAQDIVERVATAVGLAETPFPIEELFWGVRKLFERLAAKGPLVVVFDDIHWAEASLLDLIESIVVSSQSGLLLVCLAREEFAETLAETRPDWEERGTAIALERLSESAAGLVVDSLLGEAGIDEDVRRKLIDVSEGNPLFVEQLLSMMIDQGVIARSDGRWTPTAAFTDVELPPTIHALLASRLDSLGAEERVVLEAASVVGLVFPEAAVRALVEEAIDERVVGHLAALTLKHLVQPHNSADEEEAFRFRHILIRDVVYNGLLKRARATLHERFVDWADRVNRDRDRTTEFEEILGYHLEQAYGYLRDLGPLDEHGRALGDRGSERLASAGRRAFSRGDMSAAANLLRRAVELLAQDDPRRLGLLPDLGEALVETGEFAWAELYLDQAIELGRAQSAEIPQAKATLVRTLLRGYARPDTAATEAVATSAERAIEIFADVGDDEGLATAYRLLAWAHGTACRFGDAATAAEQAMVHAARAQDERQRSRAACQYAIAALHGPTPVAHAIARCKEILDQTKGDRRAHGLITSLVAPLEAMSGNFDQARALTRRARTILDELGPTVLGASTSQESAVVEMLAGDPVTAEADLRGDLDRLAEMGETYLRSTILGELARALFAQDRSDEAFETTELAENLSADDDIGSQALWRSVRARILAGRGDMRGAIGLAEEAIDLLRATDTLVRQADALIDLAEVLLAAGEAEKAQSALNEALGLLEQKGNTVGAQRALAALAAFDPARAVSS